jgi:DNA (cytosine-5)-methyltransferase 1
MIAADFFCGAGGFSLAAIRSGFSIAISCENNMHACTTYRKNFARYGQPPHLIEGDITRQSPAALMKAAGLAPGDLDLVIGGPPCQGFSVHNPRNRESLDQRNRLVLTYLSLVEHMRPKFFLIENVPGLLREGHKWVLATIRRRAARAGYIIEAPALLNARDYGVPQNRQRVFLLARRREVPQLAEWPPRPTHHHPESPEVVFGGHPAWRTAKLVFDRPVAADDPERRHMIPGPVLAAVFASTPLDGGSRHESGRTLDCHAEHDGHSDVYGRIDTSRPGPTMTTACINPSKGRFVHPWEHHGISVRHAARFQSFPDDFVFSGGLLAAGAQVGNAVPPELGSAVLAPIAQCLLAVKNRGSKPLRGLARMAAA